MVFWRRLLNVFGLWRDSDYRTYQLDEQIHDVIVDLAQQEQRPIEEIHAGLLAAGISHRNASNDNSIHWESLTPREQDVTALTCLGYTNVQIAYKLGLSPTTIKTHVRNILKKFQLHGKGELRLALKEWNFRDWIQPP
ncbi:MAG: LuxR C-terminal-related transcriptional regulator [Chloroflexota bacterium]